MSAATKDTSEVLSETNKEKKRRRTIKAEAGSVDAKPKVLESPVKGLHLQDSKDALFYAEEIEVDTRDPDDDLALHKAACDEMRRGIQQIKAFKSDTAKSSRELEENRIDVTLHFILLRKLNRLSHIRGKKVRDGTNEAKQQIDCYHLQLQNLLYEAMHLQKEINKCLEFKSKDEEIELVPIEEFFINAPKSISKPDVTKKDDHQLRLCRLDWELEQRQLLAAQLKEAQGSKEVVVQEIKSRQEYLESLQPKLGTILQSTKPVQEYLGMPFDEIREQHQTACHLPQPLYVLYMQTSAYKEACDKRLTVCIEGDLNTAKSLDTTLPIIDEESDSDQEEPEKQATARRRKTTEDRQTNRKTKVLQKHPLSVLLTISCKDGSSLQLTFHYLTFLRIITVSAQVQPGPDVLTASISGGDLLAPESVLFNLYPNDDGSETPNLSNHYELKRLGLGSFSQYILTIGRPYLWAQWMGGLEFLDGESTDRAKSSVSCGHMQMTIKRLRTRVKTRMALLQQLVSLEHGSVPVSGDMMPSFPTKVLSQLTAWKRSTYADFIILPFCKPVISAGLVKSTDIFFTAVFERSSAKLTAQIAMTAEYPMTAPLFVVNITWHTERNCLNDCQVQEMEREVNLLYETLVTKKSQHQLLTNQLQRLVVSFDVYLETETQNKSREGPVEISKEKIYPRLTRGRDRLKPFKYHPQLGMFIHR